jgi:ABC-type Zn uptake system ZnuABC Zn-binding protein ZnuA
VVSLTVTGAVPVHAQTPEKLPVVATFSILADFARNVGGERIEASALVGPNGDTHVYQPKPADAKELGSARLILVNGFGLEGWIDRLIKASGAKAPVVVATKGINPQKMREEGRVGLEGSDVDRELRVLRLEGLDGRVDLVVKGFLLFLGWNGAGDQEGEEDGPHVPTISPGRPGHLSVSS